MTLRYYDQNLVHFLRFSREKGIKFVNSVEKDHIDEFIMALKEKGLKATTINTYLRATRAL